MTSSTTNHKQLLAETSEPAACLVMKRKILVKTLTEKVESFYWILGFEVQKVHLSENGFALDT